MPVTKGNFTRNGKYFLSTGEISSRWKIDEQTVNFLQMTIVTGHCAEIRSTVLAGGDHTTRFAFIRNRRQKASLSIPYDTPYAFASYACGEMIFRTAYTGIDVRCGIFDATSANVPF